MRLVRREFLSATAAAGLATGLGIGCKSAAKDVVAYTSVDQPFSDPVFKGFEAKVGVRVRGVFDTEETKSTGVLNRLIAEAGAPQADVFWSGDPVRPLLLAKRGLIERYTSPAAADLPAAFKAADGSWTGFAARARVLLVNKNRLAGIEAPSSIRDLAASRFKGQVALANPIFGTTTMHVAALSVAWGEDKTRAFLDEVRANGAKVASSNGEVKRLVATGEVTFGLTDTDDAHEALEAGAPVEVVYPDQDALGTMVMPTSVVLIKGGPHPEAGRQLVDYLVSAPVEQKMAEAAAHMPLRPAVPTPAGVRSVSGLRAMHIDYAQVADAMERIQPWLRAWSGL